VINISTFHQKLSYIHYLVVAGSTGTSEEFAQKIKVSRSTLFMYIADLKELDIEITYNRYSKSYHYLGERTIEGMFN